MRDAKKNSLIVKQIDPEQILGRNLPSHIEAEKSVLAALLLNNELISRVIEILLPDDFYNTAHKTIYQIIIDLDQQQKKPDLVTLQDELIKKNQLETVGGIVYLISLQEDIPAMGLIDQHAQIIKEKSVLRQLITSSTRIITNCYSQNDRNIEAVLDEAEKTIFQISNKRTRNNFVQLDIWLKKTFQHLSDIKSHSKGITGIPSGYKKLDRMSSGFQNGDLIVLAARPSMGKTALSLCLGSIAAQNDYTVGFFSLEMSAEQLVLRLLSTQAEISHHNIRNATISSDEWIELTNVAAQLAQMKLFIDDTPMLSIMDLRAKARKLKAEHGLQFLIIDYLQLIHSNKKHENRHQEVSEISRSLKALAKELNIPVLALSQLSRAVDSRMDKRPMLSDLRESGAIEQDADLIMFLYRDIVYNSDAENPWLAELIVGKQRNGPTGTLYLNYVKELTKFEDTDEEPYE
ncbi:MAG: replicative DNA helicase [Candidatus Babeliales bacterium]